MAKELEYERKPLWEVWPGSKQDKALEFSEEYKKWLGVSKTERMAVRATQELVEKEGFKPLEEIAKSDLATSGGERSRTSPLDQKRGGRLIQAGDKIYDINRARNIVLAVVGKKPIEEGLKIMLSHTDSPRLDLKVRPLYEKEKVAFLKTHYYGGIKKYHWSAIPLALHGVVVKENGKVVEIDLGEKEGEPVFMITDLLPHLDARRMEKVLKEAFEAEELNIVIGSIGSERDKKGEKGDTGKNKGDIVKRKILELLNEKYGINEEDLVSADLTAVPSGQPRDLGLDRSLVTGYGQDDKVCAYTSLKALLDLKTPPEYTSIVVFTDKEEVGSEGNTSAKSSYFYDFIGKLLSLQKGSKEESGSDTKLRQALSRSKAISADVTAAVDPDYPHAHDILTNPRLGHGVVIGKYTGRGGKAFSSEASAEFVAELRNIFNKAGVNWQGGGGIGKVDIGMGGTVAMYLARYNMEICDVGPPMWNMHAPWEIVSKADIYSTYEAYSAFFNSK